MEMGKKLQDLLVTLNNFREENMKLRKIAEKKNGSFFSWFN